MRLHLLLERFDLLLERFYLLAVFLLEDSDPFFQEKNKLPNLLQRSMTPLLDYRSVLF